MNRRYPYVKMLCKASLKVTWSSYYSSPTMLILCHKYRKKSSCIFRFVFISDFICCICPAWSWEHFTLVYFSVIYLCESPALIQKYIIGILAARNKSEWRRRVIFQRKKNEDCYWGGIHNYEKMEIQKTSERKCAVSSFKLSSSENSETSHKLQLPWMAKNSC